MSSFTVMLGHQGARKYSSAHSPVEPTKAGPYGNTMGSPCLQPCSVTTGPTLLSPGNNSHGIRIQREKASPTTIGFCWGSPKGWKTHSESLNRGSFWLMLHPLPYLVSPPNFSSYTLAWASGLTLVSHFIKSWPDTEPFPLHPDVPY